MASAAFGPIVSMLRSQQQPEGAPFDIERYRSILTVTAARMPSGVSSLRTEVGGRAAEWLVPDRADDSVRIVHLHGGGYIAGSIHSHRALAARIAQATGCVALIVDYRLAPEDPFPAALADAIAALEHVAMHGPGGAPGPPAHLFVVGDSAGGGLALATLLATRDRVPVTAAVTLSPWTDLSNSGATFATRRAADPILAPHMMGPSADAYLAGRDPLDALASPLYADLAGLPPLLMQVGDAEILLDDTVRFAAKAGAAGVDVTCEVWPEMVHVWHTFAAMLPEARDAITRVGEYLRQRAR
jgi:epsilon-lactone hydrolase